MSLGCVARSETEARFAEAEVAFMVGRLNLSFYSVYCKPKNRAFSVPTQSDGSFPQAIENHIPRGSGPTVRMAGKLHAQFGGNASVGEPGGSSCWRGAWKLCR